MSKSSQAFRTIREVADWLDVAAHVLRFWESKFPQIKPVKRAGGRRYYRPADMELVGGIKVLLHDRGLTIRGVQKMIREEGVAAVAALSPPVDFADGDVIDAEALSDWIDEAEVEDTTAETRAAPTAAETPQRLFPFVVPDPEPEPEDLAPEPDDEAVAPDPEPDIAGPAQEPEPEALAPEPQPEPTPMPAPDTPPIDALAALARGDRLPPAALARLRPALAALRDRMRAGPSA